LKLSQKCIGGKVIEKPEDATPSGGKRLHQRLSKKSPSTIRGLREDGLSGETSVNGSDLFGREDLLPVEPKAVSPSFSAA